MSTSAGKSTSAGESTGKTSKTFNRGNSDVTASEDSPVRDGVLMAPAVAFGATHCSSVRFLEQTIGIRKEIPLCSAINTPIKKPTDSERGTGLPTEGKQCNLSDSGRM